MIKLPKYSDIKDERVMRACTGLDFTRFNKLVILFKEYYIMECKLCYFEMVKNLKIKNCIFSNYDEIVFFVLFHLKTGITYDVLGFLFGTSGAGAHYNITKFESLLKRCLADLGQEPLSEIKDISDMEKLGMPGAGLIIDATEIPIESPDNKLLRDESYSVKKKILHKNDNNKWKR